MDIIKIIVIVLLQYKRAIISMYQYQEVELDLIS